MDEQKEGWKLLFNGVDLSGWRLRDSAAAPTGWLIKDTALAFGGKGPNSILSTEAFGDFELTMDWRAGKGEDAGIFLRVWNEKDLPYRVAPEFQLIDNLWNDAAMEPKKSAGACNHLYAPTVDASKPVGQWNRVRVVAQRNRIEHWLNDAKVVEYEIGSEDWKSRLARSPLKNYLDLGSGQQGFIGLQQVSTSTRFRNLKIRPLGASVPLFARPRTARQRAMAPAAGFWNLPAHGLRDANGRHVAPRLAAGN